MCQCLLSYHVHLHCFLHTPVSGCFESALNYYCASACGCSCCLFLIQKHKTNTRLSLLFLPLSLSQDHKLYGWSSLRIYRPILSSHNKEQRYVGMHFELRPSTILTFHLSLELYFILRLLFSYFTAFWCASNWKLRLIKMADKTYSLEPSCGLLILNRRTMSSFLPSHLIAPVQRSERAFSPDQLENFHSRNSFGSTWGRSLHWNPWTISIEWAHLCSCGSAY